MQNLEAYGKPLWCFSKGGKKKEENNKNSGHYVRLQLNRLHSDRSDYFKQVSPPCWFNSLMDFFNQIEDNLNT